MPAAILGGRGAGKTTFLTLLQAALVRYGNDGGNFRYVWGKESHKIMSEAFKELTLGRFPAATIMGSETRVRFRFGYRTLLGKTFKTKSYDTIDFELFDVSGEEIERYASSRDTDERLEALLDSHIVVIVLDCSKWTMDTSSPRYKVRVDYDKEMSDLLNAFVHHRRRRPGESERALYPVFVLTKFDRAPEIGKTFAPEDRKDLRGRAAQGRALLDVFMPQTLGVIFGGHLVDVEMDNKKAAYFFSEVKTNAAADGKKPLVLVERDPAGRDLPVFSYDEYVGFIEHFKKVASKIADSKRDDSFFDRDVAGGDF